MGPTVTRPVLDPLPVLSLDNQLYLILINFSTNQTVSSKTVSINTACWDLTLFGLDSLCGKRKNEKIEHP